jgi:hypothetical protein
LYEAAHSTGRPEAAVVPDRAAGAYVPASLFTIGASGSKPSPENTT